MKVTDEEIKNILKNLPKDDKAMEEMLENIVHMATNKDTRSELKTVFQAVQEELEDLLKESETPKEEQENEEDEILEGPMTFEEALALVKSYKDYKDIELYFYKKEPGTPIYAFYYVKGKRTGIVVHYHYDGEEEEIHYISTGDMSVSEILAEDWYVSSKPFKG